MSRVCGSDPGRQAWVCCIAAMPLLALCCGCPVAPTLVSADAALLNPGDNSSIRTAAAIAYNQAGAAVFRSTITAASDVDVFDLGLLSPGDRIVADVRRQSGDLDAVAAVFDAQSELMDYNDDRAADGSNRDPYIDFVLRGAAGEYYLGIAAYAGTNTTGDYAVTVTITRGVGVPAPHAQTVYLDWRGGTGLNVPTVGTFDLPPFSAADLGLTASPTSDFKTRVVQVVQDRYNGLDLNLLSSDDTPAPAPPFSAVYFGGDNPRAFAVSQEIDPYNHNPADSSIVFTSGFRNAFTHVPSFEELAQAMGNTVAHEVGHLLGLVHTADCTDMMDTSCQNDRLLNAQQFGNAPLDRSVFPFGYQPEPDLLSWIIGQAGA